MIYEKVVKYCAENKMSLCAFEKMCNIGNGVIDDWKGEKNQPRIETLKKMQEATGISISEWIGG